ncbi:serine/threonine protein kinase, partial [Myxococcota bacterium]|nr:serine/threonine protein kinase [Myxococcota bacterium]
LDVRPASRVAGAREPALEAPALPRAELGVPVPRPRTQSFILRDRSLFDHEASRSLPGEVVPLAPLTGGDRAAPPIEPMPLDEIDEDPSTASGLDEGDDEDAGLLHGPFGPFTIVRKIARGRRGVLYLATLDGRELALKVLSPELASTPGLFERLVEQARRATRIDSEHVLRVIDVGQVDEQPYLAFEYFDAWTLEERLETGDRPDVVEALTIGRGVALALAAAAEAGVVHHDVAPDHVLIARDGAVRLGGLGLAKEITVGASPLAGGARALGTAAYVAPEAVAGGAVDHRSDLYALGATLFELLTARRVYEGNDASAILAKVSHQPPPRVRDVAPSVPEAAAVIVDRLLALEPTARFAHANEVAAAIEAALVGLRASAAAEAQAAQSSARRAIFVRTAAFSALLTSGALLVPKLALELGLLGEASARVVLHDALVGAVAIVVALGLLSVLALVRRGELPLPMSTAWLVRVQDGAGAVGAVCLVAGAAIGPLALLNVFVSVIAFVALASWVYGVLLRRAIALARPDRGVGRMLAVLGDPSLARWRVVHVPIVALLAALATARWAFLAYFAASAGV